MLPLAFSFTQTVDTILPVLFFPWFPHCVLWTAVTVPCSHCWSETWCALQVCSPLVWNSSKDRFLFFSHVFTVARMHGQVLYALGYSPVLLLCSAVPVVAVEALSLIPVPQAGKENIPTGPLANAFSVVMISTFSSCEFSVLFFFQIAIFSIDTWKAVDHRVGHHVFLRPFPHLGKEK